jgi:hypothetical protein
MNATCERLIGTLRREVLDRMLILDEQHLRTVLTEYQVRYNTARPHQGIAQRVPDEEPDAARATLTDIGRQQIRRKPVLGGLINEYTHAAPPDPGRTTGHLTNPIFERDKIAKFAQIGAVSIGVYRMSCGAQIVRICMRWERLPGDAPMRRWDGLGRMGLIGAQDCTLSAGLVGVGASSWLAPRRTPEPGPAL